MATGQTLLGTRPLEAGEIGDDLKTGVAAVPNVGDPVTIPNSQAYRVLARGHATKRTWLRVFHTYNVANDYTLTVSCHCILKN